MSTHWHWLTPSQGLPTNIGKLIGVVMKLGKQAMAGS
jgi:hypothetical protein